MVFESDLDLVDQLEQVRIREIGLEMLQLSSFRAS
jgi:hypothetical protein